MAEHDLQAHAAGDPDGDVNTKMLWRVGIGLAVGTVVAAALMLALFWGEKRWLDEQDPAPSPLAEANAPRTPDGPLLQPDPTADMKALRAADDALLSTYGWTDREAGTARVPISRAMEIVAGRGVAPLNPPPAEESAR